MFPAFAHVGAARTLANGVQIKSTHDALQVLVALAAKELYAQPLWARLPCRSYRRRHSGIGQNVKGRSHRMGSKLFYTQNKEAPK
jgi:hypothetical protein